MLSQVSADVTYSGRWGRSVILARISVRVSQVLVDCAVTDVNHLTGDFSSLPALPTMEDAFVSSSTS